MLKTRNKISYWIIPTVPYIPTPPVVIDAMLKLATVREGDILYDLGSGDGRIIIRAAEKLKASTVGIEFDEELCNVTRLAIREHHLAGRVRVIQGDIFEQDLSEASVVTAYLLPKSLGKIAPLLQTQLKKGARVLSIKTKSPVGSSPSGLTFGKTPVEETGGYFCT